MNCSKRFVYLIENEWNIHNSAVLRHYGEPDDLLSRQCQSHSTQIYYIEAGFSDFQIFAEIAILLLSLLIFYVAIPFIPFEMFFLLFSSLSCDFFQLAILLLLAIFKKTGEGMKIGTQKNRVKDGKIKRESSPRAEEKRKKMFLNSV